MLEHSHMARMRRLHPDWIWNRSDTHVILGVPGSHEGFKTPVEPGNSFSPGVGTYGVSTWVQVDGQLYTPEEKPLSELKWSFVGGHIPVLVSSWRAGPARITSRLFTDGDAALYDIKDYFAVELHNPTRTSIELTLFLAIRSFGAAGGPIRDLGWGNGRVMLNGAPLLYPCQTPDGFGALSYDEAGVDISAYLKTKGSLPSAESVSDETTWASGALAYHVSIEPGQSQQFDFICHVHAGETRLAWLEPPQCVESIDQQQDDFVARWQQEQAIRLDLPDQRFVDAFFAQLTHMRMFTVNDEPRISPVSYPLWWLRDGAYVVIALDKGGYHAFAEQSVKGVADHDAFGGFGAEGDGPSEGIWMLSEHYFLTGSLEFLRDVYPHIERKADLLIEMLHTSTPILRPSGFRTSAMMLNPASDLMCLPVQDGLIVGRMDGHFPVLWINGFAYMGLRRAARCASDLGLDGSRFVHAADELQTTLQRKAPELFGHNDRDTNSAFWPTGWASRDDETIQLGFERFWNEVRCPDGRYTREPMWTYFEAGQAHNYLLLGQPDRAWATIEHFLTEHIAPGLYTYSESNTDENSSLQWQRTRGWDDIRYVTPHGWTAAELFLLLRDCLVHEEGDKLTIGCGIPKQWLDQTFSAKNLPSYFGSVSFSYDPATKQLDVTVDRMPAGGVFADFTADINLQVSAQKQVARP